ncbi:BirA family biotin operon repressor/biotin-[acetyl-CoA-carboxylase] ligase [Breznakia blatticola]|uniref:BirA family biotin operon repressor/biotin-[acetyl-CoA-carboxylase] ligase n=1 Tax=Breznakia blatticola TaxID=1754012 RepID=A0A4R7ZIL7_9FIRM|nr:biotin--[acetyl-CoA-carboxylase] ligase [Breznakia blatticola]TDW16966.1 BirA family biotin operon repressor/biotin-[acetyl-CoA-carboxylase] ligase [Breznakia blatticola]
MKIDAKKLKNNLDSFYTIVESYQSISSTNDLLKEVASSFPEGTIFLANEQSKGKGRNGRDFLSQADKGLYMSVLLKPQFDIKTSLTITACAAVSVAKAIETLYHKQIQIKWINDITYKQKKLGGILVESGLQANQSQVDYFVVGIGINVYKQDFPEPLNEIASTLEAHIKNVDRFALAVAILNNFATLYASLAQNTWYEPYLRFSSVYHASIKVLANPPYDAYVENIDPYGQLHVIKEDQTREIINSGEISIRLK